MSFEFSRRSVLKSSTAIAAATLFGGGLSACGGGSDVVANSGQIGPMPTADQLALTASQVVEAIRTGRLSAEAYVRTLIFRAEQLSGLNSLITLNKDGAISAAKKIDIQRASGIELPPLAGLPIVVKDNINTADMPTTGGTPALRNVRPRANAPVVQRLLNAGAIVLGKANLHELAFGGSSTNLSPFAGPVHNPYDTTRVPGGSSGGTAAAVAARIVPAGLGTDTGGSVREPASLCGVAGFRPSVGNGGADRRYEVTGVLPISHTRDTIGIIARSMKDVALLDATLTATQTVPAASLAGLRLGIPTMFWAGLDNEIIGVLNDAKSKLRAAGVIFVDIETPGLSELTSKTGFPIALYEAHQDIPAYLAATGVTDITLADIAEKVASPDVKPIMTAVMEDASAADYETALKTYRPQMQAIYSRCFADNQIEGMIFPTMIVPAPVIDEVNGSPKVSINGAAPVDFFGVAIRNTDPGSTAGIPGITLPAGLTRTGLPVGLALDGPLGNDRKLLGIGVGMEAIFGLLPAPRLAVDQAK